MSTAIDIRGVASATTLPAHDAGTTLKRLPRRASKRDWRLVMVGLMILLVTVIVQLALSSAISQGAYEENELQQRYIAITRDAQSAQERLTTVSSGQQVLERATQLGMKPAEKVLYLDALTGGVTPLAGKPMVHVSGADLPNGAAEVTLGTQPAPVPGVSTSDATDDVVPSISGIPTPDTH